MELMLMQRPVATAVEDCPCDRRPASEGESLPGEGVRREIAAAVYSVSRLLNADPEPGSWSQLIGLLEREEVEALDEDSDRVDEGGVSMPTRVDCECRDSVATHQRLDGETESSSLLANRPKWCASAWYLTT